MLIESERVTKRGKRRKGGACGSQTIVGLIPEEERVALEVWEVEEKVPQIGPRAPSKNVEPQLVPRLGV